MTATVQSELLLLEFVEQYAAVRGIVKSSTLRGYRLAVNSLGHSVGHAVRVHELNDGMLREWAAGLAASNFSSVHIDVMRRHLEMLWRAAHAAGLHKRTPSFRYHRRRAHHAAAEKAVEAHLLMNDLKQSTQQQYRAIAGAFATWAAAEPTARSQFNAETCSQFLRDRQESGEISPWYLKSLRHGLRTLLSAVGDTGKLRKVKIALLENRVWREPDIAKLIAAVRVSVFRYDDSMKALERRFYWRTIIQGAWYTGLAQCDLFCLGPANCDPKTGRVETRRNKTGKRVVTWMPPALIEEVTAGDEPFWKPTVGPEHFRAGVYPHRPGRRLARHVQEAAQVERHTRRRIAAGARAHPLGQFEKSFRATLSSVRRAYRADPSR